jgi:probable phosphoglycerate mutase
MKISIIRHAEPDYENNTLTANGFIEADLLGKFLKDEKIDYIYSSPLPRAYFTADAIVKYNKTKTYKVLDFLHEFEPFMWDRDIPYLESDERLYDKDRFLEVDFMNNPKLVKSYEFVKKEFLSLLENHGYKKNGVCFDVLKSNHDHLVFVCHFGLESHLLSHLLNIPVNALLNHTCAAPSSVTTVYTEEREEGRALFRMQSFGSYAHLTVNGKTPSFMARFDEVFGDGNEPFVLEL